MILRLRACDEHFREPQLGDCQERGAGGGRGRSAFSSPTRQRAWPVGCTEQFAASATLDRERAGSPAVMNSGLSNRLAKGRYYVRGLLRLFLGRVLLPDSG